MMSDPDPDTGGDVPAEELAAITRHLRSVLDGSSDRPTPDALPPRTRPVPPATVSATAMLRFMAAFIAPGLLLVGVLIVEQMLT